MTGDGITDLIAVVTGTDVIRRRFLQGQQAARTPVSSSSTAPFVALPPDEGAVEPTTLDRRVCAQAVRRGWTDPL